MTPNDHSKSNTTFYLSRSQIEREIILQFRTKYQSNEFTYSMKIANDLIFNEKTKLVSRFKDFLIFDDTTEYLKKFYISLNNKKRLSKIIEFYETFSKIFPNYISLPEKYYLYKNIRRKQKIIDNFNKLKKLTEKGKNYNKEKDFFDTRIELSINKYKPHLKFKESQTQSSLLSLYSNNNNVTFLSSHNVCAKYSAKDESIVSVQNILNAMTNNSHPLIKSPTPKIKYHIDYKLNVIDTLEKISSDKEKIPIMGNHLQNKKSFLKLNLKKLHEINLLKSDERGGNLLKSEVAGSNTNSFNQGNNRLGSEKIIHKFNAKRILHKKLNSNFELKSIININNNQEDKKQTNILPDKKKIIHRTSTSIPDLRNFKIVYNNPNIIIPNSGTNINQNFCNSENSKIGGERIIIVENLNIYNNLNYLSSEGNKKNFNNFVKSVNSLKYDLNYLNASKKSFNVSPFSSTVSAKCQLNEKNQNGNFTNDLKRRSTFTRDLLKKGIVNNNFVNEEEKPEERANSKSQKHVQRIYEQNKEEKLFTKTLTKSITRSNGIAKLYGGIILDKENSKSKPHSRIANAKTNTDNNLLTTSVSKMKEIKNSYKMFLAKNRFESLTARNSLDVNNIPVKILNTEILNDKLKSYYKNDAVSSNQTYNCNTINNISSTNKIIKSNSNNLNQIRREQSVSPAKITNLRHIYLTTQNSFKEKYFTNIKECTVTLPREKSNEIKVLSTEPFRREISLVSKINTSTTSKLKIKKIIDTDSLLSSLKNKTSIAPGKQISYKITKNIKNN